MMLVSLFNKTAELVGWLHEEQYIFNKNMDWVAYIAKENAWCAKSGDWLGPFHGQACYDKQGKIVAFSSLDQLNNLARPLRPEKVVCLKKPAKPPVKEVKNYPTSIETPVGGWSRLGFSDWLDNKLSFL